MSEMAIFLAQLLQLQHILMDMNGLMHLLEYIDSNIDFVKDYCAKMIPEIIPVQPEATYMIWLDCRKFGMTGKELQNFFVNRGRNRNE